MIRFFLYVAALIGTPSAVLASAGQVLALCQDITLTPETRLDTLRAAGWQKTNNPTEAFVVALTLTRITAGKPEEWAAHYTTARAQAPDMTQDSGFLNTPDGRDAVFIGRDSTGLQTCLYLGGTLDMAPLSAALDGSILRTIGEVTRIRGDGVKSLVTAHGMTEDGRDMFDPRLAYAMTFTVVLDRQPSDLE